MNTMRLFFLLICLVSFFSLESGISTSIPGTAFDRAAGSSTGELFVASSTVPTDSSYSVSRMVLTRGADGAYSAKIVGMIPEYTFINRTVPQQKTMLNPLRDQYIGSLSTYNTMPLVAYGAEADHVHSIALIQDIEKGGALLTHAKSFGDALGQTTQNILMVTGGAFVQAAASIFTPETRYGFVFAAVSPSDAPTFEGQPAAGIAVAQIMQNGLFPLDLNGGSSGPSAAAVPSSLVEIEGDGTIASVNALCWNEKLHQLFVALTTNSGGVAVLTGSLTLDQKARPQSPNVMRGVRLQMAPCITGTSWDSNDYIVANKNTGLSINHLAVMNASTGKNFVVVARGDSHAVYAAPITSSGVLAQKNDSTQAATEGSTDQLYTTDDVAVLVGGTSAPAAITALHVRGDAVYVSCNTGSSATRGVFSSQALFDATGAVYAWSSWQRVQGCMDAVLDFSQDTLGRIHTLNGDGETLACSLWGRGDGNELWGGAADNASAGLVSAINTFFPSSLGGVHSVVSMHNGIGSSWYNTAKPLHSDTALLAFSGRNRCALALTCANGFFPTGATCLDPDYFFTYDLAQDDLSLGMLSTIAISRSDAILANEGWIFVGSMNGVAVLRTPGGSGFDSLDSLTTLTDDSFSFKELKKDDGSSFSSVSQIVTDESAFYVVSVEGVYRCQYSSDAFKNVDPDPLTYDLIASPTVLLGASYETILSMTIVGDYAFLGTSKGLWVSTVALSDITNAIGDGGWREVTITPGGSDSFGVCGHVSFVPGATKNQGGMVYVLTADISLNVASVYRVCVESINDISDSDVQTNLGAVVHQIEGVSRSYMTLLGQLREYFYTDGGLMIDASSKHHAFLVEGNGALRELAVSPSIGTLDAWGESVQPALSPGAPYNTISGVVRDNATGTLIVPGSWGIQILQ